MTERHLFDVAVAIADPARRRAYLDDACRDEPALRTRVERLLESHFALLDPVAGVFLSGPAVRRPDRLNGPSPPANIAPRTPSVATPSVDRPGTVAAPFAVEMAASTRPRRRGVPEVIAVILAATAVIVAVVLLLVILH